jgi:hypothetical protein
MTHNESSPGVKGAARHAVLSNKSRVNKSKYAEQTQEEK